MDFGLQRSRVSVKRKESHEISSLAERRFLGRRFLGRRFLGRRFLGRRFLGRRFLGRRFLGRRFLGRRFVGRRFLGRRFLGRRFLGRRFLGRHFLGRRRSSFSRSSFSRHPVYGKRQTAKMKLLPSVFSSLYSRIKTFLFAAVFPLDRTIAGFPRCNQRRPPEKRKRGQFNPLFYKAVGLTQA